MISKSFLKSSIVFTVGGALPMLAGIILLPFYTNYLSEVHYTQILFYISISMLFQILFSFSIENYFGIKYTQLVDEPTQQKKFIGTTSALLLIIGALILLLSSVCGDMLFRSIYKTELGMTFWPYGFYSVLTGFFNAYFKAASIALIYLKKPGTFILSNTANFIVTVIISVGGLILFPGSIIGPIFGRLISGLVIFLIGFFIFKSNGTLGFDRTFLKDLFHFCLPYVFYVISGWVLAQVDRYVLQAYIPNSELNAYDLLLKCFLGIEFIQNSLSAVIYPKVYEIWAKNKNHRTTPESNRYFNVFTALNVIQLILFCIFIPLIYRIFVKNPAFYQSESYIGILAAGFALRSILSFYLAAILFTKQVMVLLKLFGYSALLQLVVTWWAVKYSGLSGAIYAGLAIKVIQVGLCMYFSKEVFDFKFNYFKIILIPLLYLLMNTIQFIVFKDYSLVFYCIELGLFGLLLYAIFSNEIKKVVMSFKSVKKLN